jgi:uncharacterized iron-regulated protein
MTDAAGCVAPGAWADGAGRPLATNDLLRRAAAAPVVLLGEIHDNPDHHRWQLQTLAALHALVSGPGPGLAIGLEMFPRRVQPALDRWVAGEMDEAAFLREVEWNRVWAFDPALYLPILHFARMNRVPLVALNVERALVSRTHKEGWRAIPGPEREGVGDPAPPPAAYRERLAEAMAGHDKPGATPPDPSALDRFVEAQLVWDRAMAEGLAGIRARTGRLVVGLAGAGHLEGHLGIPFQLKALGVEGAMVLLPWDRERPCSALDGAVADAVFGLDAATIVQAPARPRLGVLVEEAEGGLRVKQVVPAGLAAAAGVEAGDLLTEAAGVPLRASGDLTAVVGRQAAGTWLPLVVRRAGGTRSLVARFPAG